MMIRGVGLSRMAHGALAVSICVVLAACGGSGSPASSSATGNVFTSSVGATSPPPPADASTTLSWSAPTRNSDGTRITNLAGYTLHYGTASQDYTGRIEITSPTATSYVVSGTSFPPGTYYFAISAYNAEQVSSSLSGEVSVTVD